MSSSCYFSSYTGSNGTSYTFSNIPSSYDGQWTLSLDLSNSNATVNVESNANAKGVLLGNGKLAMITGVGTPDIQQTITTGQLGYTNGTYKANVLETFYVDQVKFFDNRAYGDTVIRTVTNQSLNMYNAIHTTSYNTTYGPSNLQITTESDLYTPQQYPFVIMQTLRIVPSQDMSELDFFHEIYTNNNITNVDYNNNVIFNETINDAQGIYILSGKANTVDGETMATASLYLIEPDHTNLGFNIFRGNTRAYNRFQLKNLVANQTYRVHIVSTILSSSDFHVPLEECKRMLLTIANSEANPALIASKIRGGHTNAWASLWSKDINIAPKVGISDQETNDLFGLKRQLRYSMYNIMSCVRDNINVEVNPLNLSVIDYDGSILYNGDLWFIPLLMFIRPDVARALLEYRHKSIDVARQLAAGYGYKGAKFPYINDTIGYKNALYWDTVGPMSLFNSGLVAINVWNYYRITKDRDWLIAKGYPILKDVAELYTSIAKVDVNGVYHMENVQTLNGTISTDQNALTNNIAKLSLKYAIEASYELNYFVKDVWLSVYYGLPLLTTPDNVLLYDANTNTSLPPNMFLNILEPMFVLIPYYSQIFFNIDFARPISAVLNNLTFYADRVSTDYTLHPFNQGLRSILYGLYAQYDPSYVTNFSQQLYAYVKTHTTGAWGHMTSSQSQSLSQTNDIVLNAILIFIMLQGAMQMNIQGGVAETRFYYEDMKINSLASANLPNSWKTISVTTNKTYLTTNKLFYVGGLPCA